MSESKELSPAQKLVGDFAPRLAELTDAVLFGDVWERADLSKRDRSLVTVAALIANGNTEQLTGHLNRAKQNGLSETELAEVIIHLALFYEEFAIPADSFARMVAFAISQPEDVDVNEILFRPTRQEL